MRTAEELLKQEMPYDILRGSVNDPNPFKVYDENSVKNVINAARKEVIEECAEKAKSGWVRHGTLMGHAVEKQSILMLIDEIK